MRIRRVESRVVSLDSIFDGLLGREQKPPPPLPYEKVSDPAWNDKAAGTWTGEMRPTGQGWQALAAQGECPRCGHGFDATVADAILMDVAEATRRVVLGENKIAAEFTILCQCDREHEGRPLDATGCGAAWNFITLWEQTTDEPANALFLPGSPVDWEDRRHAEAQRDLAKSELVRVREAGDKWKTGLSLLLGLIATVSVVKGRDSIEALSIGTQHAIIVLLGGALAFATAGALLAMRAANGPLAQQTLTNKSLDELRSEEIRGSLQKLRLARVVTVVALAVAALAVGIAWWSEEATPGQISVKQQSPSTTLCGKLNGADADEIRIETAPGIIIPVPLTNVVSVAFKQKC
jgi:hypothetical protein